MEPQDDIKMPPLERKRKKTLTPAGWILLVGFFLLCVFLGYKVAQLVMDPLVPKEKNNKMDVAHKSENILNILLLGVDQRKNESARSDTIILASFNLEDKEVHLLSIPRDTKVDIPGKGSYKINHADAVGGPELAVTTVEKFLDVPVHYYVQTNFEGFRKAIDILGGVTINVEQRMYLPEEDINLKAGLQKLNGYDALAYVRWRSDGKGDIGRIERQQKFFKALAQQAVSFSTVWKIPELVEELNKYVKTDMPVSKMITLANKFRDIKNIKLETHMVPGAPVGDAVTASYWIADRQALAKLMAEIYKEPAAVPPKTATAKK
ncbi:hypothetical protein BR63_12325 [Thermanaerosceptrum fracticalcis]|uniref:Cell envelope-related transcriptional attenuator domain-containing protein n=1 Tax=Thermanaerosceptrum fracticalcis TaxID=1712410 RepID=A0A7G6E4L9_THEFR|nr:LCP family protein [Thermanaerosceptrum fracticalcis]QNB47023.1 hypothetical protein BR63_12325 [Thermanaerosceptrum fracticalcis]